MTPQPPSGQGPIDPRGAFSPPPPPSGGGAGPMMMGPPGMMPPPGMYPPPGMMGPPMYGPPMMMPPMKQGGGFARAILTTLATSIFGLSLALNLYLLAYSGLFGAGEDSLSSTVQAGKPDQKIVVIPVKGIIYDVTAEYVGKWLERVGNDANVKAIVLRVESPGGTVTASDQIYDAILDLRAKRSDMKVVVSMGAVAASGGYYISAPADYIFAEETTITGSIGVILQGINLHGFGEKYGIKEHNIIAPKDSYKGAFGPFSPMNEKHDQIFQSLADQMFARFKGIVKQHRKLNAPESEVFNAAVFTTADAMKNGLVDQAGYEKDATDYAAKLAGLTQPTIERYERRLSFFDRLGGAEGSASSELGFDGKSVQLKVDSKMLDEAATPRMLYLWRGQ